LPAIAGNEGVGVVEAVGSEVGHLRAGDWVIPAASAFGTWRTEAVAKASDFIRVPNDIPLSYAATMTVNPATAYRLLRDFEKLKPGDVVMQNGANSMVGLAVIQMAREMGLKTVNIIRSDRPDADSTIRLLTNLGGDVNVTDLYVNAHGFNEILADLPPCKLALNCVGGDVVTEMSRVLAPNGTLVTYGGMSKRPLVVPMDVLAYKQLKLKGFWISEWYASHPLIERATMIADIAHLIRSKQLALFHEMHDFDDFDWALSRSLESYALRKVVLNIQVPDRLKEHDAIPAKEYEVFETTVV